MDITYRSARPEDLEAAGRVVQRSGNALRVRHGGQPSPAPPSMEFPKFCLARDPSGLWVAVDGDTIVGFGFSWMIGTFWFLSTLFVSPEAQAKGIGQALLSKTMMQAERGGAANRGLITLAYNTASTGLYLQNGLYPREPLYRMTAPAETVAQNIVARNTGAGNTGDPGYDVTPIAPWPESGEWIGRIDQPLLGFRRDLHHQFLLSGFAARAVRIEHAGHPAGYAYISAQGNVGPLAIAPDADAKAVVTAALRCALEGGARQVSMIVPGRADVVMQTALALGFRVEEPYVLMAQRPFGNWCNYLPSGPGFM
jgi:ribosomal protein S18 acetylase RimI-like enzyme